MQLSKRQLRQLLFILLFLLIGYLLFAAADIYFFSGKNELTHADAAVILGAAVWNEAPSPVFRERINHGIWLYKNGYAKKLIFTGGTFKGAPYSESSVGRRIAMENSIPPGDIYIEEHSRTTYENMQYAAGIIKALRFESVTLVSDPLHMKRAVMIAKDMGINAYSSPTTTTSYVSAKTKIPFLMRELAFYMLYRLERDYWDIIFFSSMFILMVYFWKPRVVLQAE